MVLVSTSACIEPWPKSYHATATSRFGRMASIYNVELVGTYTLPPAERCRRHFSTSKKMAPRRGIFLLSEKMLHQKKLQYEIKKKQLIKWKSHEIPSHIPLSTVGIPSHSNFYPVLVIHLQFKYSCPFCTCWPSFVFQPHSPRCPRWQSHGKLAISQK